MEIMSLFNDCLSGSRQADFEHLCVKVVCPNTSPFTVHIRASLLTYKPGLTKPISTPNLPLPPTESGTESHAHAMSSYSSSYYSDHRTPSTSLIIGTYQIIRSSPITEQDWAEATDEDAPADEWDDAEYHRQMQWLLMKQYEKTCLMDLRRICKGRGLRVRGNKVELVERLATADVEEMYGGSW